MSDAPAPSMPDLIEALSSEDIMARVVAVANSRQPETYRPLLAASSSAARRALEAVDSAEAGAFLETVPER
jgi:hypothetical protein